MQHTVLISNSLIYCTQYISDKSTNVYYMQILFFYISEWISISNLIILRSMFSNFICKSSIEQKLEINYGKVIENSDSDGMSANECF